MLIYKKILTVISFCFLCAGCTYNQQKHFTEIFTKNTGALNQERDIWIVEQSLESPSEEFSLKLQPCESVPELLLKAEGIPLNERMIFAVIDPVKEKIDVRFEFERQRDGSVAIFDRQGTKIQKEISFVEAEGLLSGKQVIYAIVAKEKGTIATVEFIPYPLEETSLSGAHLSIIVTHPMLTKLQLRASGFTPQEIVKVLHISGEREEMRELAADETGAFSMSLNPLIFGKLGGQAALVIIRENEEIRFNYPWGSSLEKKTFEERKQFPIHFVINNTI
ncbi:MAG: hypothetical protein V4487_06770 [Chlamydiota bacterium]